MTKIFISYRRRDSGHAVERLYEVLASRFPEATIFLDVHSIDPGENFAAMIDKSLADCDLFFAVIGEYWLKVTQPNSSLRRIDHPNDYVRLEIVTALKNPKTTVVPILVDTTMPPKKDLPAVLHNLTKQNGVDLRLQPDFGNDVQRIVEFIAKKTGLTPQTGEIRPIWRRPNPPRQGFFVGRTAERIDIEKGLQTTRIAFIHGMGGVGKTAFLKHVGHELANQYPAGVFWAELNEAATEATLQRIWGEWLQAHPHARNADVSQLNTARIKGYLSDKPEKMLVCIDDVWSADILQKLLETVPDHANVVITTRDIKHIPHEWRVGATELEIKHLSDADALKMLMGSVKAGEKQRANLQKLATMMGNHALALDLAAAWLAEHGTEDLPDLIERLQYRAGSDYPFIELSEGDTRDRNLEIALDLSYQPLKDGENDSEKQGFRLLSIIPVDVAFREAWAYTVWGVDMADMEQKISAKNRFATLKRTRLVEKIERDEGMYYRLHRNLWQYANALRLRAAEGDAAYARYAAEVRALSDKLSGSQEGRIPMERWNDEVMPDREHLERHMDDLADAVEAWLKSQNKTLESCIQATPPTTLPTPDDDVRPTLQAVNEFVTESGVGHWVYWRRVGANGLRWLRVALVAGRTLPDRAGEGYCMGQIGSWHQQRGEIGTAVAYLEAKVPIDEQTGNQREAAATLNNIGELLRARGDYTTALDHYQQSLEILREIGNRAGEAVTLNNIGLIHDARGDYTAALDHYQQALVIHREVDDRAGEAVDLNNIGAIHDARGDYTAALDHYQQSLEILRDVGDRAGEAVTLNNIGAIHKARGDYTAALDHYQQSLVIDRELGDRAGEAVDLNNIGAIHKAREDYTAALDHYQQSLEILREIGNRAHEAGSLNNIGAIHDARGDYAAALDHYQQSLVIKGEIGDRAGEARTLNNIGMIHDARGDYAAALDHYQQSLELCVALGDRAQEAVTCFNIGYLLHENMGRTAEAIDYVARCVALDEAIGHPDLESDRAYLEKLRRIASGEPAPPQAPSQDEIMAQLKQLYQVLGADGLREILQSNGVPDDQIAAVLAAITGDA